MAELICILFLSICAFGYFSIAVLLCFTLLVELFTNNEPIIATIWNTLMCIIMSLFWPITIIYMLEDFKNKGA